MFEQGSSDFSHHLPSDLRAFNGALTPCGYDKFRADLMSLINLQNLTLNLSIDLFRSLSLVVGEGERLGIVAANGRGNLSLNHWNGSVSTQIRIVDAAKVDLSRQ